jgi:hypothetical protein
MITFLMQLQKIQVKSPTTKKREVKKPLFNLLCMCLIFSLQTSKHFAKGRH